MTLGNRKEEYWNPFLGDKETEEIIFKAYLSIPSLGAIQFETEFYGFHTQIIGEYYCQVLPFAHEHEPMNACLSPTPTQ